MRDLFPDYQVDEIITERDFTAQVVELAGWLGWKVCHFRPARTKRGWVTAILGDKGFPDCVFSRRERVIFAELKVGKGKLTKDQVAWLESLKRAPVEVYIWRPNDIEEIERILRR